MERINFGVNVNNYLYLSSIKEDINVIQLYISNLTDEIEEIYNNNLVTNIDYLNNMNNIIDSLFNIGIRELNDIVTRYKFIIIHIPKKLSSDFKNTDKYITKLSLLLNLSKDLEHLLDKKIYVNIHINNENIHIYETNTKLFKLIYSNINHIIAEFCNFVNLDKQGRINFINKIITLFNKKLLICIDTKHTFINLNKNEINDIISDIYKNKNIIDSLFCIHLNDFKNSSIFNLFTETELKELYLKLKGKFRYPITIILERNYNNRVLGMELKKIKGVFNL